MDKSKSITVYYEVFGHGQPILMIHGYSVDHRLMEGCMEPAFTDDTAWKRIYFDQPGMGHTEAKPWIKNANDMLDIILGFTEAVIPEEHFLVAGESYGGLLARGIVFKKHDLVDGVLLICPCIYPDFKKRTVPEMSVLFQEKNFTSTLSEKDAELFNELAVVQNERIWKKYQDEVLSGINIADNEFLNRYRQDGYSYSFNVDEINFTFDKPSLILVGRQDPVAGYRDAWQIIENYPRATFAVLDMAGHGLQIEQEELFTQLVKEWLKRVELNN
ncbi:MAG: 2-hydroxy-6-oxo-6-phenylhexa-2,4-dienoate hydrolase [Ignavibacteria bacterium RBG_13_36_8]|nr:MAG: 2-hydroxy-6-oxo-6-phenylhexa-2,4-dienoate hydrolase [Ignavibacteria bacterium RBG_13_36_8]